MSRARRGAREWLAVVAMSPWLLGARGCIEELSVGVERGTATPDASVAQDGGVIDGGLAPCEAHPCTSPAPAPRSCSDNLSLDALCVPAEENACEWQYPDCPPAPDAGPDRDCRPEECDFVISFETTGLVDSEFECADGSAPSCQRNDSGFCSYRCPEEISCSLENDRCASGTFCVFALGTCGNNGETAYCRTRSDVCPESQEPVCGCDGTTYGNTCKAFQAGVSISFNGSCDSKPTLCDECELATFSSPQGELCADGLQRAGKTCVQKPKGGCAYQWLACPPDECESPKHEKAGAGECWSKEDCAPNQDCLEVSVCPCNASCFAPDQPGHCG